MLGTRGVGFVGTEAQRALLSLPKPESGGNLTTYVRAKSLVCRRCIAILATGSRVETRPAGQHRPLQERGSTDKITRSRDTGRWSEPSRIQGFANELGSVFRSGCSKCICNGSKPVSEPISKQRHEQVMRMRGSRVWFARMSSTRTMSTHLQRFKAKRNKKSGPQGQAKYPGFSESVEDRLESVVLALFSESQPGTQTYIVFDVASQTESRRRKPSQREHDQ